MGENGCIDPFIVTSVMARGGEKANGTAIRGGGFSRSYSSIPFVIGFLTRFDTHCLGTITWRLFVTFDFAFGVTDTVINAIFGETAAAADIVFGGNRVG